MSQILDIPWRRVRPMPDQPRSYFDKVALRELAESIEAIGQVVPAQVTPVSGDGKHDYELIDGQRRWHAIQLAGLATIRAEVVAEADVERRFNLSVVANFARQPNHPMEVARAIQRMRKTMTVGKVASVLGKNEGWVYKYISLLDLHPDLADMLHPETPRANRLPFTVAVRLAAMGREFQVDAWNAMQSSGLSPSKAMDVLVPQMPPTGKQRVRVRRKDELRVMTERLSNLALELESRDDAWFGRIFEGRLPSTIQGAHAAIDRLQKRLTEVKSLLP